MDDRADPADRLEDALSRLEATRGERDAATVADRRTAADRVAETAAEHPSVAAERTDAVCEAFVAALEGEGGTVAQDTVPGRADEVASVNRSLARAVGAVAETAGASETVVDAVVTGLRSDNDGVVAASAEAAAPLVEAGPPEAVVAALSDALVTADDAVGPLTDRLSTLVEEDPGALAPHAEALVEAATDRSVETTVLRLVESLAEAAPEALTAHADRLADTADRFLEQGRVSRDGNAARISAPAAVALYALAEARPDAVADETPTIAGFADLDPDPERAARGVRALRSVARERPGAVADAGVVEPLADYLHDVGVVNEGAVEASAAPAALETLAVAARSRPEVVADHVERVLDAVRQTDADDDDHAAALTATVASERPAAVAGGAAALGDLLARADSPAVARDWLAAVDAVAGADATGAAGPLVDGVAAAVRTHDDPAVHREGLAALRAVGPAAPDALADAVDAVLTALDAVEDPADGVDLVATAAEADPGAVADRADAVVAAAGRHATDTRTAVRVLSAVAETAPGAVTDDVDTLVDALDDAPSEALSALRAVAADRPDAVADHVPAVADALRDAAADGAPERATDALSVLVAVSGAARGASDEAETVAAALGDLPDTAAVLDDALSATPPETTRGRGFVLAVFEALVAAVPDADEVDAEEAAAARRTMTTVQRWAERVREESSDAVVGTDAMMLRSDARERASALESAGTAGEGEGSDRLVDHIAEDRESVDYVPAEAVAEGATMDFATAVETVRETAPDGPGERRTEAARTLTAVAAQSPSRLVDHLDTVAGLLGDADAAPDDPEAANRTAMAATAMQGVATGAPQAVAPYAERLVGLLSADRDPEVRAGALGALAFLAHRRPDAVAGHADRVADAAATVGGEEATVDAAVLRAFAAAASEEGAALGEHAGTLATTAASAEDPDTAGRALFHLRRVAREHPGAVADHLDTVVEALRDGEDVVARRGVEVMGVVGTQDPGAVTAHLPEITDALVRADPDGTAARLAVLTLGSACSETPTVLIDTEGVDLAATIDAVAGVLAASDLSDVADNALVVFAVVASRRPELVVPHLDAVAAARERYDDENVANRALGVLVGVATADPSALEDHLETLLEWLAATDPEDDTSLEFLETGLRGLVDVVRETPAALRPHLDRLLAAGDATPDTREVALTVTYVAVRGDLDTAADHLDRIVALVERTTQEGTKFGAAAVLGAAYVGGVSRATARRVGRAIADAPDPIAIVGYLTDSLAPEPDGCTALVAMLQGVVDATDDRRVAVVAEVGIVRALSESTDPATAGAVGDCLATMGSVTAPYAERERLIRD